jgi:hypothetical protein
LTAFTVTALGQTASEGAGAPGTSGNPGMNNQQSDERNQPNAPSRPRNTMNNGAMNSTGGNANAPADSMPNTTQSVAPGSAPQGSNMPQMAKPRPRTDGSMTNTNRP